MTKQRCFDTNGNSRSGPDSKTEYKKHQFTTTELLDQGPDEITSKCIVELPPIIHNDWMCFTGTPKDPQIIDYYQIQQLVYIQYFNSGVLTVSVHSSNWMRSQHQLTFSHPGTDTKNNCKWDSQQLHIRLISIYVYAEYNTFSTQYTRLLWVDHRPRRPIKSLKRLFLNLQGRHNRKR